MLASNEQLVYHGHCYQKDVKQITMQLVSSEEQAIQLIHSIAVVVAWPVVSATK